MSNDARTAGGWRRISALFRNGQSGFALVELKKALAFLVFLLACCLSSLADRDSARTIIHRLVRDAESRKTLTRKVDLRGQDKTAEVMDWISMNRESIEGTRSGPFDSSKQYVSLYTDNKIYVHVLDWGGKNNISLPAVIDRPVERASLLHGPPVRVDQA